jgi:hypothetical protein
MKNVQWHKGSNRWVVEICIDGRRIHGGYFTNIEEAEKRVIDLREEGRKGKRDVSNIKPIEIKLKGQTIYIDEYNIEKYNEKKWYIRLEQQTGRYTPCTSIVNKQGERQIVSLGRYLFIANNNIQYRIRYNDLNPCNCVSNNVDVIDSRQGNIDRIAIATAKRELRRENKEERLLRRKIAKEQRECDKTAKLEDKRRITKENKEKRQAEKKATQEAIIKRRLEDKTITIIAEIERVRKGLDVKTTKEQKRINDLLTKLGRYTPPPINDDIIDNSHWIPLPDTWGACQLNWIVNINADYPNVVNNSFRFDGQLYHYNTREDANIALLSKHTDNLQYEILDSLRQLGLARTV